MKHDIKVQGFGVRLRPVRLEDSAFIVWLRNLEHAKGRVGDSATSEAAQHAWLETYFDRDGDYYFVIETVKGTPVGAYGIYDLADGSAESGRWVIQPDVPAAIPSAILAFQVAFDILQLRELRVKTVSSNRTVLSLNRRFGFRQTRVEKDSQVIGGQTVDQIHFLLTPQDWIGVREKLIPLAQIAQAQIEAWDNQRSTHS
jgi:RimJ/RimL family protein N-acetyltransferase